MAAWKLPVIVAALRLPLVAGFVFVGPALGMALGALAVTTLLVVAARQRPREPIGAADGDDRSHVLLVVPGRGGEPGVVEEIVDAAGLGAESGAAEVLVLSPARIGFLDRWASDVEGGRRAAPQTLVAPVAALAKAGVAAEARVGDEDVVQAVEDQLQGFPASEVVLVSEGGEGAAAAGELSSG